MKEAGQPVPDYKPVLELNPQHALVLKLLSEQSDERFNKIADAI